MPVFASLLATLLVAPSMSSLQSTPAEAVVAAFERVREHDWEGLARLVHPDRLEEFRSDELGMLLQWARRRDELAAGVRAGKGYGMNRDTLTPQAIAAVANVPVTTFRKAPTFGQLAALTPEQFFVEWCTASDHRTGSMHRASNRIDYKREIVGTTVTDDSMAYVIYRQEMRTISDNVRYIDLPGQAQVMPLKRAGDKWLLLLNREDVVGHMSFPDVLPIPEFREHPRWDDSHIPTERRVRPILPQLPSGSAPARRSASAVAAAAFEAFEQEQWKALAMLVHPKALSDFRERELEFIVMWIKTREQRMQATREGSQGFIWSVDTLTDDMVKAIADVPIPVFADSATVGQIAALSPADFFVKYCEAIYADAEFKAGEGRRILGEISEGEALAHVLYTPRSGYRFTDPWKVLRLPVTRTDNDWGILLNDDIVPSVLSLRLMSMENPETDR